MRILSFITLLAIIFILASFIFDSPHGVKFNVSCNVCHSPNSWKLDRAIYSFDHNKTAFKLDGSHQNVPCAKCHKNVTKENHTFVLYKIKEWKCENCH